MPPLCACFSRGVPAASSSSSAGGTGVLRGVANRLGASFKLRFSSAVGAARYYQDDVPTLVNPAYLESRLKDRDQQQDGRKLHVLDCTWYLPNQNRSAADEFMTQGRIVGAKFFDLDAVADTTTSLPHMLPSEGAFAAAMDALGIKPEDGMYCTAFCTEPSPADTPSLLPSHCLRSYSMRTDHAEIVCYDRQGVFSAPRAWWTMQAFGHKGGVSVLNGGLPAWQQAFGNGYMMDTRAIEDRGEVERPGAACSKWMPGDKVSYASSLQKGLVKTLEDVVATYEKKTGETVIDARPAGRWQGVAPEPRKGLPSGHVPGSKNIPWDAVLETIDTADQPEKTYKRFKSENEIREVFAAAGLDARSTDFGSVVASCGSGTTACILVLASEQIQGKVGIMSVYDGSWSEYGASGSRIDTTE